MSQAIALEAGFSSKNFLGAIAVGNFHNITLEAVVKALDEFTAELEA
ncbi:hypothetical protein [Nostoc sp. 'Lobaria pulmonaria (5183) cyanobiont']|nr:hypothetical protein [Nostoc sp. 'Lobaria pulmonaria (5183) cyanobiont']